MFLCIPPPPTEYIFHTPMTWYRLFVLKVSLNSNRGEISTFVYLSHTYTEIVNHYRAVTKLTQDKYKYNLPYQLHKTSAIITAQTITAQTVKNNKNSNVYAVYSQMLANVNIVYTQTCLYQENTQQRFKFRTASAEPMLSLKPNCKESLCIASLEVSNNITSINHTLAR